MPPTPVPGALRPYQLGPNTYITDGSVYTEDGWGSVQDSWLVESYVLADGSRPLTADWDIGGFVIKNSGVPVDPDDLATKAYVDAAAGGGGTVTSVALSAPSSILSVSGSPVTTTGTLTLSLATQSANLVWAGPTTGAAATPAFRALVTADLPSTVGTVKSVALSVPIEFAVAGSPITTTGTLAVTWNAQGAHTFLAGPAPAFRVIATDDLGTGTANNTTFLRGDLTWQLFTSGTVTSVALAAPAIFSVSGSPVTTSGTLTFSLATQSANLVWAGPTTGSAASPTFRALVTADMPAGTGTVTSVALAGPAIFSVSGSPVTTTGTLTFSLATQTANLVWAGPTSGGAATPTFRSLVAADMPAGTGTVTSVALSLPAIFSVSGSPVTTTGTLTASLATQSANLVWAGPTSGSAAAPAFRALVALDLATGGTSAKYLRGDMTWTTASLTPGGATTNVQFNSSGTFGGDSGFTYTTPGQIALTPTSTSALVMSGTMPASFAGSYLQFKDSGGAVNFQVNMGAGTQANIYLFSDSVAASNNAVIRTGTGYFGSTNAVGSGWNMGALVSGTIYAGVSVRNTLRENWSSSALGSALDIFVCKNTTTTLVNFWRFDQNGDFVPNNSGSAAATSDTGLMQYFTNTAGVPTGAPTTRTGATAFRDNSTDTAFYRYCGATIGWSNMGPGLKVVVKANTDFTLASSEDVVHVTLAGGVDKTATLDTPTKYAIGKRYLIVLTNTGGGLRTLTIARGSANINGAASNLTVGPAIGPWRGYEIYTDGTDWYANQWN